MKYFEFVKYMIDTYISIGSSSRKEHFLNMLSTVAYLQSRASGGELSDLNIAGPGVSLMKDRI